MARRRWPWLAVVVLPFVLVAAVMSLLLMRRLGDHGRADPAHSARDTEPAAVVHQGVLALIISAPDDIEARQAMRQTWLSQPHRSVS